MMEYSKFIVITTINPPTAAVREFCKWDRWETVVVGDHKTPGNWACPGATYLGLERQAELFGEFSHAIPENAYARKMLGYTFAIQHGAQFIFESDDDNIPFPDSVHAMDMRTSILHRDEGKRRGSPAGWLNSHTLFGVSGCWPRGFPLEHIKTLPRAIEGEDVRPWAVNHFLVEGDSDVDAIYRMVLGSPLFFAHNKDFIVDSGTFCPINSQSTLWTPEAYPLLFLPVGIPDRVADILRGYIASVCLWKAGYSVAFSSPISFQKRNNHNLHVDFLQEIPLYSHIVDWCNEIRSIGGANIIASCRGIIRRLTEMHAIPEENTSLYESFLSTCGLRP